MTSQVQTRKAFSFKKGYSIPIPSGSSNVQLVRMPWQTPVQKPGIITKVLISNPVGTAGTLSLWDQDLSNTTPPTRGSAGQAVLSFGFSASGASGVAQATTSYTREQIPEIQFVGGIASQSTLPGGIVAIEVEYI